MRVLLMADVGDHRLYKWTEFSGHVPLVGDRIAVRDLTDDLGSLPPFIVKDRLLWERHGFLEVIGSIAIPNGRLFKKAKTDDFKDFILNYLSSIGWVIGEPNRTEDK